MVNHLPGQLLSIWKGMFQEGLGLLTFLSFVTQLGSTRSEEFATVRPLVETGL